MPFGALPLKAKKSMCKLLAVEAVWLQKSKNLLVGKTIIDVRYLSDKESKDLGVRHRPIALVLADKNDEDVLFVWPMADEEGDDSGVLFTESDDLPVIPKI